MIGSVGQTGGEWSRRDMAAEGMGPGKKMNAVGHQAKAAVSVARELGFDLPRNAQGIAASGIARGVDPASLLAALAEPPVPEEPAPVVPDVPDMPMDPEVPDAVSEVPVVPDSEIAANLKALAVPVQDAPPVFDAGVSFGGTGFAAGDVALQLLDEVTRDDP